jgi:hypothetical protein
MYSAIMFALSKSELTPLVIYLAIAEGLYRIEKGTLTFCGEEK